MLRRKQILLIVHLVFLPVIVVSPPVGPIPSCYCHRHRPPAAPLLVGAEVVESSKEEEEEERWMTSGSTAAAFTATFTASAFARSSFKGGGMEVAKEGATGLWRDSSNRGVCCGCGGGWRRRGCRERGLS